MEKHQKIATILSNQNIQGDYYKAVFQVEDIPLLAQPGQFIHLLLPDFQQHVLRRPFSIYDTAIRGNRRLLLETGTVEQANSVVNIPAANPIPYIIGIGNVYTPRRNAGHIVNMMEVRNSTIIIQNK